MPYASDRTFESFSFLLEKFFADIRRLFGVHEQDLRRGRRSREDYRLNANAPLTESSRMTNPA